MRGPTLDQRPLMGTAEQWQLAGGAYRESDQIILPTVGAYALCWIPCGGLVGQADWTIHQVMVPEGAANGQVTRSAEYRRPDRTTSAKPTQPASGSVYTLPTLGQWAETNTWTLKPGGDVGWLRLIVRVTGSYGQPGTKFIPTPADLSTFLEAP